MSYFSATVQTKSIQNVLVPIASQVSHLTAITKQPLQKRLHDLQQPALNLMVAVQNLAMKSRDMTEETSDKLFIKDMQPAYEQSLDWAKSLRDESDALQDRSPPVDCSSLHVAAKGVFESIIKVLLIWDQAEVRKIKEVGMRSIDRLRLVQAAKSMRGLLVCYNGFSESLHQFITLVLRRKQDLIALEHQQEISLALSEIKQTIVSVPYIVQDSVGHPNNYTMKEKSNAAIDKVIAEILRIIEVLSNTRDPPSGLPPETTASTLRKAQHRLSTDQRYSTGPELDHYISIIYENSKKVSNSSKPQFKAKISQLCDQIQKYRTDLDKAHKRLQTQPDTQAYRHELDMAARNLCDKLQELDRTVADAVVDQVTSVFVQTSQPLERLVTAVTSESQQPPSQQPETDSPSKSTELKKSVELFRRHSFRLSEVALQAAEGTTDARRAQQIKDTAKELETLTQSVVNAAFVARKNPQDEAANQQLKTVRQQWFNKVNELTSAIDDIIAPHEFAAATKSNILGDMKDCETAYSKKDWARLVTAVQSIAAKAERMCKVARSKAKSDLHNSHAIKQAVDRLERAVNSMRRQTDSLINNNPAADETTFANSLERVLNHIRNLQTLLETIDRGMNSHHYPIPTTPPPMSPPVLPLSSPFSQEASYLSTTPSDDWIGSSSQYSMGTSAQSQNPSSRPSSTSAYTQTPVQSANTKEKGHVDVLYPGKLGEESVGTFMAGHSFDSEGNPDQLLLKSYAQPLERVVKAAKKGDSDELYSHTSALTARAIRLTRIAETAAASVDDSDLADVLQKESAKITQLTPILIRKAEEAALDGSSASTLEELDDIGHQWAGHVRTLITTSEKANLPWSKAAKRLVSSAKSRKGLEREVAHISTQTEQMMGIATSTIEAAKLEDAIGSTSHLEHITDPEVQEQIDQVKDHMKELQKITPEFISTATEMAKQKKDGMEDRDSETHRKTSEQLNLLSHEWATTANVLMKGVDDITLGMSGPVDSMLIAANSGDPALLEERSKAILNLVSSLETITKDAVEGCNDQEQIASVLETVDKLKKLTEELVETSRELAIVPASERGEQKHQLMVEKAEIIRRDWASKMQLVTVHIDDLTAEAAAPMDRLISVALQASRTDGMAKDHLLSQFEKKAQFIIDKMEDISTKFKKAAKSSDIDDHVETCSRTLGHLNSLTPHGIGAARALSNNPTSALLDHFSHLRRQWASKAQLFSANLNSTACSNLGEVNTAFQELLQGHSFIGSPTRSPAPSTSRNRSYSNEVISPPKETGGTDLSANMSTESQKHLHPQPRPLTVPNQSFNSDYSINSSSASIVVAAQTLHEAASEFHEDGNPFIGLAKTMSTQMYHMADYIRGRDSPLQSKSDMITAAKTVAANALQIFKFAHAISEQCLDSRVKANLVSCAEMIPTLSTQLRIIASVKSSTPEDASADIMLVKNAQNLMLAVTKTITAAEAAYVKGLKQLDNTENEEEIKVAALAMKWKRKLYRDRTMEAFCAPLSARGLRKLNRNRMSTPSLSHVLQRYSPTKNN